MNFKTSNLAYCLCGLSSQGTSIHSRLTDAGEIVSEDTAMDLHPTQGWARKKERGRGPGNGPGRGGMRRSYSSYRKQKPKLIVLKVPNHESTISL